MDYNIKTINWNILKWGITIPVFFTVLIQFNNLIEQINSFFSFIINLETFTAFLLIFVSCLVTSIMLNTTTKKSFICGAFLGFISGVLIQIITLLFAFLLNSQLEIVMFTNWIFFIYLTVTLTFQTLTGGFGGVIGSLMIKENN